MQVDGELVAVPVVIGGVVVLVESLRATTTRAAYAGSAAAGALAACSVLVKQNMLDVFVVAAVLLAAHGVQGRWRDAGLRTTAFAGGALGTVGVALLVSAARGTGPASLWDAIVTFRAQAAAVIHSSANVATPDRFHTMLIALVISGVPLVVVTAIGGFRRPEVGPDLRWAALALLAWELVGAALGGSYWLHYLLAVVPGVVLVVTAARPTRALHWGWRSPGSARSPRTSGSRSPHPAPAPTRRCRPYLRSHSSPTDTVVVAFGHPNIVRDSGLASPYEHLWSLSVRVRDPQLHELTDVLSGPGSPRWVVVDGASLATWGVDPLSRRRCWTSATAR